MGLNHPRDLGAWQQWQGRQRRMQRVVTAPRRWTQRPRQATPELTLTCWGVDPSVLIAVDSRATSSVLSLLRPAASLTAGGLAVLATGPVADLVDGSPTSQRRVGMASWQGHVPDVAAVLTCGDYLPVGAVVDRWARTTGRRRFVAQHGLLTPFAPPLPSGAELLAWSEADAAFWRSDRDDITTRVVGSQMLWEAAAAPSVLVDRTAAPTYLGQLHGAELPRRGMARSAERFCRESGATYRPHPSEVDTLSRLQHALWERTGIRIDRAGGPLSEVGGPVVAAFSTGVLEAAARGIPSWVAYDDPPRWLEDFWERYGMRRWGGEPTPGPARPPAEPASAIADVLRGTEHGG